MKNTVTLLLFVISFTLFAQKTEKADAWPERMLPAESAVNSTGSVNIKGKQVPYKVTAGTQPVYNAEGKTIASLFYTLYERTDVNDKTKRPFVMSFNGGPGSASVWMHVAYTGPKVLNIDSEGYPVQPYGVKDNPNSILDVADIVYIDPVNTGFSRILDSKAEKSTFFGVNADIKYLADWLDVFVSRTGRWLSPKYLIGESYGTTRVSGLALELQNSHWAYLNGVILVSPTELGIKRDGPVGDGLTIPYYTAAAWYHKMLPPDLQAKDLDAALAESEAFAMDELIPALSRGGFLDDARKRNMAAKISRYTGLSEKVVLQHNLTIPTNFYWK